MLPPVSSSKRERSLLSRTLRFVMIPFQQLPCPPTFMAATLRCKAELVFQQIRVFRMLGNIALHELAVRDHLQVVGPYLVERALDQFRADALAAQFGRHLGVIESNDPVGDFVVSRGYMAVGRKFEPVFGFVIDDFAHLMLPVGIFRDAAGAAVLKRSRLYKPGTPPAVHAG